MTAHGIEQEAIAAMIGVGKPTSRKHFRREIDRAPPTAKRTAALYKRDMNGCVIAQVFWLKVFSAHAGMRRREVP